VAVMRETGARGTYGKPIAALGFTALRLGNSEGARQSLREALEIAVALGDFDTSIHVLPFAALYIAEQGSAERAVELASLANRHPFIANSALWQEFTGKPFAILAATLPPEIVAAAQMRGRQLDLWVTIEELAAESKKYPPAQTAERRA
jgi:hypothetical protein